MFQIILIIDIEEEEDEEKGVLLFRSNRIESLL